MTVTECVVVPVSPAVLVTVSTTGYVPPVANACVGMGPEPAVESPKSQAYEAIAPAGPPVDVEASKLHTSCAHDAVNAAVGG